MSATATDSRPESCTAGRNSSSRTVRLPSNPGAPGSARIEALQSKLAEKNNVIAEIMESHVALKETLAQV